MASASCRLSYVTDYEGNYDLWRRFTGMSKVLKMDDVGKLFLNENDYFVFGGDVFDKGPGDLRFAEELLDLKARHPNNVFLIVGNRDLNKIRLTSELHESDVYHRDIKEIPGPFWVPPADRVDVSGYLEKIHSDLSVANTQINRLKYILDMTMNCPETFEHRRRELSERGGGESISDEEVYRSFVESLEEGGVVRRYLENSEVLTGPFTNLDNVGAESIGFVPSDDNRDEPQAELKGHDLRDTLGAREWIGKLNAWKDSQLKEWIRQPHWDATRTKRGGEALMAYFYSASAGPRTVTVSTFVGREGFQYPSPEVIDYLHQAGIRRVVTGHRPLGDTPILMRDRDDFEVLMADTSFSDPTCSDNRGVAIAEAIIVLPTARETETYLHLHGITADHLSFDFAVPPIGRESIVGKRVDDGFTVTLDLGGGLYRLTKGNGRNMVHKVVRL